MLCTDPYVPDQQLVSLEQALREADVIVVGAPHHRYKNLEFSPDKIVFDIWNLWPHLRQAAAPEPVGVKG